MSKSSSLTHFCFDLDGTLIDSNKTIYQTTLSTLDELNIKFKANENEFFSLIGKHFIDIFNHFNLTLPDFEIFIKKYKSKYFDFIYLSKIYPDVKNTLHTLKSERKKISLLTTKAQDQADLIIDHFEMRKYFDLVMGRRDGIEHKPSPQPLLMICDELNVNPADTLMIGDTELDIQCGKNTGTKTCAVLYGYRQENELKKENPDYLVQSIREIIILS